MMGAITPEEVKRAADELGPTATGYDVLVWMLDNVPPRGEFGSDQNIQRVHWFATAERPIVEEIRRRWAKKQ